MAVISASAAPAGRNAIVITTGSVEAWQNDNVLKADTITFDRNTNVAAASGRCSGSSQPAARSASCPPAAASSSAATA